VAGERRRRRLRRGSGNDAAGTESPARQPPPAGDTPGRRPPGDDAAAGGTRDDAPAPGVRGGAPAPETPATIETSPGDGTARGPGRRGVPASPAARAPSPSDLAELGGTFALTTAVHDPDAELPEGIGDLAERGDDPHTERGLRGLVGGGSSQVGVAAAMRARDAARPTAADVAAAEADLVIIRRGWVPREELPRGGPRRA
jgi:hypothetical protein